MAKIKDYNKQFIMSTITLKECISNSIEHIHIKGMHYLTSEVKQLFCNYIRS